MIKMVIEWWWWWLWLHCENTAVADDEADDTSDVHNDVLQYDYVDYDNVAAAADAYDDIHVALTILTMMMVVVVMIMISMIIPLLLIPNCCWPTCTVLSCSVLLMTNHEKTVLFFSPPANQISVLSWSSFWYVCQENLTIETLLISQIKDQSSSHCIWVHLSHLQPML